MNEDKILDRLNALLQKHNIPSLPAYQEMPHTAPAFGDTDLPLQQFCDSIELKQTTTKSNINDILGNICEYTHWATKKGSTFVFLLRDMFLSYLITKHTTNKNCIPLIYGRKILKYFYSNVSTLGFDYGENDADPVYLQFVYTLCDVACEYNSDFDEFFRHLKPKFLKLIKQNKEFYTYTKNMLNNIKAKKIIVIECGRFGTIPLILKCIDDRIDLKLFATGPEMYQIYKKRLFAPNNIPLPISALVDIEKSISQNELFVFSSIKDNQTMVKVTTDKNIIAKSKNEINNVVNLYKQKYNA